MKTTPLGEIASTFSGKLQDFLSPILLSLNELMDVRLVRTFAATIQILLQERSRPTGLLLSELGAYISGPEHAPAGTKRLSNLLRSTRWKASHLQDFLLGRARSRVRDLLCRGDEVLVLWDESVLEKPDSIAPEGLCSVRSSVAARLKRIKQGFFTPPGGPPVFVPGMQWISLMVVGMRGPATLALMKWWTKRGELAEEKREVEDSLLQCAVREWGESVLHVFDRGYAGAPWLSRLGATGARFVMRWTGRYYLQNLLGESKPAWKHFQGKRALQRRNIWDARRKQYVSTGIIFLPIRHHAYPGPLWLIATRPGPGRDPWYLLTSEPITTPDDAWRIVHAYSRRWQVEMSFRFLKCEMALESPRLWAWENRMKLLWMVSLAYAFLLELLRSENRPFLEKLIRTLCPRTGKRSRVSSAPLYRLRIALSHLARHLQPLSVLQPQNSG